MRTRQAPALPPPPPQPPQQLAPPLPPPPQQPAPRTPAPRRRSAAGGRRARRRSASAVRAAGRAPREASRGRTGRRSARPACSPARRAGLPRRRRGSVIRSSEPPPHHLGQPSALPVSTAVRRDGAGLSCATRHEGCVFAAVWTLTNSFKLVARECVHAHLAQRENEIRRIAEDLCGRKWRARASRRCRWARTRQAECIYHQRAPAPLIEESAGCLSRAAARPVADSAQARASAARQSGGELGSK